MKNKRVIIIVLCTILVAGLFFLPVYSRNVDACSDSSRTIRKVLVLGNTKQDVDDEVNNLTAMTRAADCNIKPVKTGLYIL